jgi:magnesium-transporting ATPase (P-type)
MNHLGKPARQLLVALFSVTMSLILWELTRTVQPPISQTRILWLNLVMNGGTILALLCFVALGMATAWSAFRPEHTLDERQRALRNFATHLAYRAILLGLLLVFVYFVFGPPAQPGYNILLASAFHRNLALAWALIVATALPTLVIAWLEPDPVRDERSARKELGEA